MIKSGLGLYNKQQYYRRKKMALGPEPLELLFRIALAVLPSVLLGLLFILHKPRYSLLYPIVFLFSLALTSLLLYLTVEVHSHTDFGLWNILLYGVVVGLINLFIVLIFILNRAIFIQITKKLSQNNR